MQKQSVTMGHKQSLNSDINNLSFLKKQNFQNLIKKA